MKVVHRGMVLDAHLVCQASRPEWVAEGVDGRCYADSSHRRGVFPEGEEKSNQDGRWEGLGMAQ